MDLWSPKALIRMGCFIMVLREGAWSGEFASPKLDTALENKLNSVFTACRFFFFPSCWDRSLHTGVNRPQDLSQLHGQT